MLHRFLAFPVVDPERRLLGAIDVELYTDELRDLGGGLSDDLFQLVGVHLAWARQLGPLRAFRSRFPWLMCNITGGIAAAFLGGIFQAEIEHVVALALFIPVVLALAESVSIQSISLALQVLHGKTALLAGDLPETAPRVSGGPAAGRRPADWWSGWSAWRGSVNCGWRLRLWRHRGRRGQRDRVGHDRAQPAPPLQARSPSGRRPRGAAP